MFVHHFARLEVVGVGVGVGVWVGDGGGGIGTDQHGLLRPFVSTLIARCKEGNRVGESLAEWREHRSRSGQVKQGRARSPMVDFAADFLTWWRWAH